MQLDRAAASSTTRRSHEKYQQHQVQKTRDQFDRSRQSYRFERMMNNRLKSIDETLRSIESRITAEVDQRVATAVQQIIDSDVIRDIIDERVRAIVGPPSTPAPSSATSPSSSTTQSDSESCASSTCAEPPTSTADEEETASCSELPIQNTCATHYPNKWEFITTLQPGGKVTDFRLEQFTAPVRSSLKLTPDEEIFPRMSLEEMIERDHPTTSDSDLFDEKKISCKNRPRGKELTDEEFFCLAPCCSDMRLYQAASCPFLPAFVRNRLNKADDCKVIVQRTANGIELITPIKWQLVKPIVPETSRISDEEVPEEEEEEEAEPDVEEEAEEEDPEKNRKIVEQLMIDHFIPSPSLPLDDAVFGPYLKQVREADTPQNFLRDLVRRVNSNLDNSYKSHQELELFAELDQVPIDEKYGRLPFNSMGN